MDAGQTMGGCDHGETRRNASRSTARQPREKKTAVPSEARAPAPTKEGRGRAPWRRGATRGRSPARAAARAGPPRDTARPAPGRAGPGLRGGAKRAEQHTRPHDPPNRPKGDECSRSTARRDMKKGAASPRACPGIRRRGEVPETPQPRTADMVGILKAEGSAQPRGARYEPRATRGQGAASARNEQGRRAPPSKSSSGYLFFFLRDIGFLAPARPRQRARVR